jgi:hypothetical protein
MWLFEKIVLPPPNVVENMAVLVPWLDDHQNLSCLGGSVYGGLEILDMVADAPEPQFLDLFANRIVKFLQERTELSLVNFKTPVRRGWNGAKVKKEATPGFCQTHGRIHAIQNRQVVNSLVD